MKVKVKMLSSLAKLPCYAKEGDAGLDLTATSVNTDEIGNIVYGTGLAFEIPEGHVGLLFPRSSISKYGLVLSNSVGVIDSGYRGEVMLKFRPLCGNDTIYKVGERIAQLIIVPYPQVELVPSNTLSETERGAGGYGSSGV